jgi:hypothetical protein
MMVFMSKVGKKAIMSVRVTMLSLKDKRNWIVVLFMLLVCTCQNGIPNNFTAKETLIQPNAGHLLAIYGYHNADALSGYDELYLKDGQSGSKKGNLVLRIRGQISKVTWLGSDTLEVWSDGYLRVFNNIDGLPIILKMHHIEQRL